MQGNAREPLRVTQEAVDAYEKRTGFQGIGKIMVERGVWVIVPSEDVVQPHWRSVENSGLRLQRAVVSHRHRANPATTGLGGSS
jgi:hypothetical protein